MNETWARAASETVDTFGLPGGYFDAEGCLQRECVLRAVTGWEEELLADQLNAASVPVLVTRLLSRCIQRLGSLAPITPEIARQLLIADREYVLLKLRQAMFGDHVQAVLACPACEQKMDLDFDLEQVGVERRPPAPGQAKFELSPPAAYVDPAGGAHRLVAFRLPTGADQEYLAGHAGLDEAGAVAALLARCLVRLGDIAPVDEAVARRLNDLARREIEAQMESMTPRLEWEMDVTCPECGQAFVYLFNFAAFFLAEANLRREQLYREVHFLALHYHWPLSEILSLTRAKRRTFLELLGAELQLAASKRWP